MTEQQRNLVKEYQHLNASGPRMWVDAVTGFLVMAALLFLIIYLGGAFSDPPERTITIYDNQPAATEAARQAVSGVLK